MTHYDTLEISPKASAEVVRAAYRSLMQRHHPDRNAGDAAAAAQAAAITQAYDVLSDAARRAAYDRGIAGAASAPALATGRASPARAARPARAGVGSWLLWIVAAALVVGGAVWLAAPKADARAELLSIRNTFTRGGLTEERLRELYARKEALLLKAPQLRAAAAAEHTAQLAARTIDLLDAPLAVRLEKGDLTIPRLRVVLGSFDTTSLRTHMEKNRERLVEALAERLARADAERLAAGDEAYLKAVIARALALALGTKTEEDYPSTYFESPGRHGVIDVLLPERYTARLDQLSSLR